MALCLFEQTSRPVLAPFIPSAGHSTDDPYLSISDVHSQVDVAKATAPDFSHESILSADLELGLTAAAAARHSH